MKSVRILALLLTLLTTTITFAVSPTLQSERIAVFVSAPSRGGFLDTSKDIQDSVKDIRGQLNGIKGISVVETKEMADIVLTVVGRGVGTENFGQRLRYTEYFNSAELTSTPIVSTSLWVSTVMQIGDYKKEITGTDQPITGGTLTFWSNCAKEIANNLEVWVKANAAQIKQLRTR